MLPTLRVLTSAALVLLGVGTAGLMVAAWEGGASCRAETGAWVSAVALEAARSPAEVEIAVAACYGGSVPRAAAEVNADTFFVIPSFLLVLTLWRFARTTTPRWGWRYGAAATIGAAVFDVYENAVIRAALGAPWPWVPEVDLAVVSTLKWLCLVLGSITFRASPWHRVVTASMLAVLPGVALGAQGLSWLTLSLAVGWTAFGLLDLGIVAFGQGQLTTR